MKVQEALALIGLLFAVCVAQGLLAQGYPDVDTLFQQLQSRETTDNAKDLLLKRAVADSDVKKYLANKLPSMIDQGGTKVTSGWLNAVRLAGELKIAEAAPALGKWIGLNNVGGEITSGSLRHLETNPAGKALAQIGDPSIPVLVNVLEHGTPRDRYSAYLALGLIHSTRSIAVLRDHLDREDNQEFQKEVKHAIAHQ
jgi:HEAT repeat protein